MRKPRDYDAELKALSDKARTLKERRVRQLGELVVACGSDALTPEQLAGVLLAAMEMDPAAKEVRRKRGAAFFQRTKRGAGAGALVDAGGAATDHSGKTPA